MASGRQDGKLSHRKVEAAAAGTYDDGRGLRLVVKATGSRHWILRYQIEGRRRDMGLGPFPEITLARARGEGRDPLAERSRRKVLTFRAAAEALIESKRPGWRNAKHAAQWGSTLATYAHPKLGDLDVRRIETMDVLAVLQAIWTAKPETASRLRQRIEAVLDYAGALKARDGDNPARWRGHLDHLLPAPAKVRAVTHHAALDWREAPSFMRTLLAAEGIGSRALAFAILHAARSGEVRGMTWSEIDLEAKVWTVPGARTKAAKEHRVPLVHEALALLGEPGPADALIFPSPMKPDRPISDVALTAVLRRMGRGELTVHGFRSTFRDWAGEASGHPREVIEAALAHRLKDKAEAAYARGDLFQKRRNLMADWAAYLTTAVAEVAKLPQQGRKSRA